MRTSTSTAGLTTFELGSDASSSVEFHESNALVALRAFGQDSTAEPRAVALRAVEAYVDRMRAAEFPPEQVVMALKSVCRRAGLARATLSAPHPSAREHDMIAEEFVSAAIRRLYQIRLPAGPASTPKL